MVDSIKSAISIHSSADDVIFIETLPQRKCKVSKKIAYSICNAFVRIHTPKSKTANKEYAKFLSDIEGDICVEISEINVSEATSTFKEIPNQPSTTEPIQDVVNNNPVIDPIIAAAKNSDPTSANPSVNALDVSKDVQPSVELIETIIPAVNNPSQDNDSDQQPYLDSMVVSHEPAAEPIEKTIPTVNNSKPANDEHPSLQSVVVSNDEQPPMETNISAIQVKDTDASMKQGIHVLCNDSQPSVVSVTKQQHIGENAAASPIRSEEVTDIEEGSTDLKIIISLVTVTDPVSVSTPITDETVENPLSDEPIAASVEEINKISTSKTGRIESEQMDHESISDILQQALIDSHAIATDDIAVNAEDHLINELRTSEAATTLKINFLIHCLYRDTLHKHMKILKLNGLDNQSKDIHNRYMKENLDKNKAHFDKLFKQSANKIRTNYLNLSPNNQISFCTSVISDMANICANENICFDSTDCFWLHNLIDDAADDNIESLETIAQDACFKDKQIEIYRINCKLQQDRVLLDWKLLNVRQKEEEQLQREQQYQLQQEQLQSERQLVQQQSEQLSQILQRQSPLQLELLQRQSLQQSSSQSSQQSPHQTEILQQQSSKQIPQQVLRLRSLAEMLSNAEPAPAYSQPSVAGINQMENQNQKFAMHQLGPLLPPQHAVVQSRQTPPPLYLLAPGSNGINVSIVGNGGTITANLQQRLSPGQNRSSPLQSPMQQQQVVQQQMQSSQQSQQSQQQQQQIQLQQQRQLQQLQNQQIAINTAKQPSPLSNLINILQNYPIPHPNQLQNLPTMKLPNPSHSCATPRENLSLRQQLQEPQRLPQTVSQPFLRLEQPHQPLPCQAQPANRPILPDLRHSNFGITYSHPDYPPISFLSKRPSSTVLSPELCSSPKRIATTGIDQNDAPRTAQMTSPQSVAPPPPHTPYTLSLAGIGPNIKDVPKKPMQRRHSVYQELVAEKPIAINMFLPQYLQPGQSSASTQYRAGPVLKNADVPKTKRSYTKKSLSLAPVSPVVMNPPQIAQLGPNSAPAQNPKLKPNMAKKPMKRRHSVYQESTIPVYAESPVALPMQPPQNPQPGPSSAPSIHSSRQPQRRNSVYVMPPSHTGVQPPIRPTSKIYELAELQKPNHD